MKKPLSLAALALSVSACSLVEDYLRPETPVPAAWSTAPTPADAPAPAAAWPAADWWRGFNAPTLDAYMKQAEAANFDLAAAIARVKQADAQARINGAPLLPAVDLAAGGQRAQNPVLQPSSPNAKPIVKNTFSTSLSASYELDFWGKNAAALESAEAAAQASRYDQQTVFLTMQSSVATAYFDSLGLQDRLAVARANV
ncbi:MAG: TolC family protein, partial [Rhodospirillaceae bacterium]